MESKMKFGKKFAFGLGDFGGNFCFSFISSFALIYFTDIAGANVLAISTLLLIAKALDGITDLITGHLIDKTHSKMGKARPWLFWSAFPLAIAMILLFSVPGDLGQQAKSAYIFIFYVLVCAFFYTANNISYNALTALITNNEEDRVSMGSIRFMLTAVAGIIIGTLTTVLVQIFGTGQKGWTAVAALYAVIFLICTMITVFSVKEVNNSSVEGQRKNEVGWLLAAVGYNGKDITDGAITMIQISYLFIPVILGILVIVCFLFMNIEEENKRLRSGSR